MEKEKTPFLKSKVFFVIMGVVAVAVIFVAGTEYKAYQARRAIREAGEELSKVFGTTEETKNPYTKVVEKKVGEEFELATAKVKVNGIEEKQIINVPYFTPLVAKENSKFVVLNLDITNITKESFVFNPEALNLVDSQERSFGNYNQYVGLDNNLEYKELAPNITLKGVLVYELPNDATSYALEINKGGTDERYRVVLK